MKIISGGQNGVDIAALKAAHDCLRYWGDEKCTGGWMPMGWMTLDGPRPEYEDLYDMLEYVRARGYRPRTYANVRDSHATIRLAYDFNSPGEICTANAIEQYKKPSISIDIGQYPDWDTSAEKVLEWADGIRELTCLNIAGNSEKTAPGIERVAYDWICGMLSEI